MSLDDVKVHNKLRRLWEKVESARAMNIIRMTTIKTNLLVPIVYVLNYIHRSDNSLSHYLKW